MNDELLIGLYPFPTAPPAVSLRGQGHSRAARWFGAALASPWRMETRLIPDEQPVIERTLIELCDTVGTAIWC